MMNALSFRWGSFIGGLSSNRTGSKRADTAKRLIEFLASERTSAAIQKSGMEPVGKRSMR